VMVEEGLFDKFPCDAVFALHNKPGIAVGAIAAKPGPLLAASDRWDIRIKARGTHAAHPHLGIDPFVIGAQIVLALQTIGSRNVDPLDSSVVSIGFIRGGSAYNVIPDDLHIGGTSRSFRPEVRDLLERRLGEIARGVAALHGASAETQYRRNYPPTINHAAQTEFAAEVAAEICGPDLGHPRHSTIDGRRRFLFHAECPPGGDAVAWQRTGRGRLFPAQCALRFQ